MKLSVSFCPGEFSGIMFGLEVFVTFGSTELENLAIVTNESHAVSWIDRTRTEIALIYSHFNNEFFIFFY